MRTSKDPGKLQSSTCGSPCRLSIWDKVVIRIGIWTGRPNIGLDLANFFFQRVLCINAEIPWPVHFTSRASGNISIGENVWKSFAYSGNCYIQGINGIEIGANTIFAPGVKIISANHKIGNISTWDHCRSIVIGKNVWIGANVTICPGVHIGDAAVVGANAVVASDIPAFAVAVGVPARVIRYVEQGSD